MADDDTADADGMKARLVKEFLEVVLILPRLWSAALVTNPDTWETAMADRNAATLHFIVD